MRLSQLCNSIVSQLIRKREPLFGAWYVEDLVGEGGFACVYKLVNRKSRLSLVSALKIIPIIEGLTFEVASRRNTNSVLGRYIREVRTLAGISSHPNLISLQNFETIRFKYKEAPAAVICIMMDFLPHDLKEKLKEGPYPIKQGLDVILDCLRGLEKIHSHNVIHRDIKPANIFLDDGGRAMIGDFGIAGSLAEPRVRRKFEGTMPYMAPESLSDPRGKGYSEAADLYALALVAYEILAGRPPFQRNGNETLDEAISRRMEGEPIPIIEGLPEELNRVLIRALAFDPDKRFESADHFKQALESIRENIED